MKKSAVLRYYGGNAAQAARAIGVSRVAVHKWPARVPVVRALQYEQATRGALRFNLAEYDLRNAQSNVACPGRGKRRKDPPTTVEAADAPST